jgi:ketosteroid isomerase-like protein
MPDVLKTVILSTTLSLVACATSVSAPEAAEAAVARRLAQYVELLRRQDAPGVAAMFEPSGSMAHQGQPPVVGRRTIQAFLESFASYKVLAHQMQVASVVAQQRTVQQSGTFAQTVVTTEGRTVQVGGTFVVVWRHRMGGQWLIQNLRTAPSAEG